ncbi:MAG TPA: phosphoglycerate kinase [Candidatus Saccharimonadia bacterium]|nr:phosphoglycerate kinase [Candidatus Saccharimonadia bacterium]
MHKKTVRDIDLKGKRVLVRVDYNVPIKDGKVGDTLRIRASFETLNYLLEQGCALVLMSHLGEPKGAPDPQYSLRPVAAKAAELLGHDITFYDDCVGEAVEQAAKALQPGQMMMLENVRFHQEELDNDAAFAKRLAGLGEVYVNDAFAVEHRKQASVVGVAAYLPAVAGLLVEKEVNYIAGALEAPQRPLVAVLGGAKVSTKLPLLKHLMPKVDVMVLTGPIANTFALAQGQPIGQSVAEPDMVDDVKELLELARRENTELLMPDEVVVSQELRAVKHMRTVKAAAVQPDDYIVDAAPSYAKQFTAALYDFLDLDGRSTVIWNGPLGLTEVPEFTHGTQAMAEAIVAVKGTTIVGGGDTAAFVDAAGLHDKFTWVSTGGGASLELMAGKELPGVAALLDM